MPLRFDVLAMRRAAVNGALMLAAFAVALLAGELLVRRAAPRHRPLSIALRGLYVPDPALGYAMRPGFARRIRVHGLRSQVRTNSLGMRDDEPGPRDSGTRRILGLGDSFTLGVHAGPRDSCFVERLEHDLSSPGARVEVWNAGVDGYGTQQEIALLERIGPRIEPDAVLLAFYLGNDFVDNSGRTRMTVVNGYQMLEASAAPFRAHFRPLHRRLRLWLHAHSELYLLLKERLVHPLRRPHATTATGVPAAPSKAFEYYIFDSGFAHTLEAAPNEDVVQGIEATRAVLGSLRAWCDAHGAPALVVMIPAEQQVDAAARRDWVERFGLDGAQLDFELPNRRLATLASEAGLQVCDLTPVFAAHTARGEHLYLEGDNHWNAAGHALAAATLQVPLHDLLQTSPHLVGAR